VPTDYDVNEIARLLSEGKSMTEIATALDGPVADETAAENRRQLQEARGRLNAESASPAEQPSADPVGDAFHAAEQSGHSRGSDARAQVYFDKLFAAAAAGDERVVSQGVVSEETKQRWMADAHRRQIANREQSGLRHR
jgi:hypothetical protein